ncbi:hypothetical protein ACFV1N_49085 [Streptosporangium canum]|uniref:hypothetical protein n=1 Tax=Streptosporangium canum TaxID=324952 RepID=UPI0036869198
MPPPYADDRLSAATKRPAAGVVMQRLRVELNNREIYPSIVYDKGPPRLVHSDALTVWANHIGTVVYWGPDPEKAPTGQMPADDLAEVARRLAEQVYGKPATP